MEKDMKNMIYVLVITLLSFTIYSCAKKSDSSSSSTTTDNSTDTSTTSYVGAWVKSSDNRMALDWKSDSFSWFV